MEYAPKTVSIDPQGGDLEIKFLPPANCQFRYGLSVRNFGETFKIIQTDGHLSPIDHANDVYDGINPAKLVGGNVLVGFEMYKLADGPKGMQIRFSQDGNSSIVTITVKDAEEASYLKVLINLDSAV